MINKREKLTFLVVCFGLVFFIYTSSLFGSFVFDDRSIVAHQPFFSNIDNFHKVLAMPYWTDESGLYRPVVLGSYALNYMLFGTSAFSFHLVNLVFYAFIGYLLFLLIAKIFPRKKLLAYLSPLLFLVLPIHTEVVANIVGRAEIFALFFSLLALLEVVKNKINPWKIGLWVLFAIASKEVAVAVLPIMLFVALCKRLHFKKYWPSILTSITAILAYLSARFLVLGPVHFFSNNASWVENPLKFVTSFERIATAFKILFMYIKKSFWPFSLCSDYSYSQISIVKSFDIEALFGLAIFLFFAISSVVFLRRKPVLAFASFFFFCSFLLVSNLFFPIGTIAGERLVFFASVGLCIYLAYGLIFLSKLKPKKFFYPFFVILVLLLICFYGGVSFVRSYDWITEEKLFVSAGKCASNSVLSRSNLGTVYYFRGEYDKAEEEFLVAYNIYDKYSKAINNLGLVYWKKGEYEKAKQEYFRAIKNWPPYEGVYENLILLYLSQGKEAEAQKWWNIIYGQ